jgi:hypothetical protein
VTFPWSPLRAARIAPKAPRRARSISQSTLTPPHLQVLLLAPQHLVAQPVELLLDRQTRVIVALKEVLEVEDEVDDGAGPCLEKLYLPIVAGLSPNLLMALMTSYLPWREDRRGT